VKLLDWGGRGKPSLEADPNPFAKVVLAHLKALETTRRSQYAPGLEVFASYAGLYEGGFDAEDVRPALPADRLAAGITAGAGPPVFGKTWKHLRRDDVCRS